MKPKNIKRRLLSLASLLLLLSLFTGCGEYHPAARPPELSSDETEKNNGTSDTAGTADTDETDAGTTPAETTGEEPGDLDPTEIPFTVALSYNGAAYIPQSAVFATWTDGYSYYQAQFDNTGVASVVGLDGDYQVTLSGLPDGYVYNPNIHTASNSKRNISIEIYKVGSTRGRGTDLYQNIINISKMGVYQTTLKKEGQVVYYQFVPKASGTYSVETWVDVTENNINPQIDVYNGTVAYKVYAETLDEGGTSSSGYTKNARYVMNVADSQVKEDGGGVIFAFGIKATSKNGQYPITVHFSLTYNGEYSYEETPYTMILPTEQFQQVQDYDSSYTFTWAETQRRIVNSDGSVTIKNVFEGSRYKFNEEDGYYHVWDEETQTYGPILYAKISAACRFIDRSFTTIEQENKALTVASTAADGSVLLECYKLFIEGWEGLEAKNYNTKWQVGLTEAEIEKYKECHGYGYYCNSDGVYPVTAELQEFLQKFSVSHRYFMDGEGWVETNPSVTVDALEDDQWLFACGYYAKNGD